MTTFVASWGVGRPDYSQNVEFAVNPALRSHQLRGAWTSTYSNIPYFYFPLALIFAWNARGDYSGVTGWYIYGFHTMINSNRLIKLEFISAVSLAALIAGTYTSHGGAYGYNKATLKYSKGYYIDSTRVYAVVVTIPGLTDTSDVSATIHGLNEEVLVEGT